MTARLQRLNANVLRITRKVDFDGAPVNLGNAFPRRLRHLRAASGNNGSTRFRRWLKRHAQRHGAGRALSEAYRMQSDGRDGGKAMMIRDLCSSSCRRQASVAGHARVRRPPRPCERRQDRIQQHPWHAVRAARMTVNSTAYYTTVAGKGDDDVEPQLPGGVLLVAVADSDRQRRHADDAGEQSLERHGVTHRRHLHLTRWPARRSPRGQSVDAAAKPCR